jgi:hypothetical protein
MKKIYCLLLLFFINNSGQAQNLVPNPSFEDTVACPIFMDELYKAVGWTAYGGSPDYFNACATPGGAGVPLNIWGFQAPLNGNAYALVCTYEGMGFNSYREFIGCQLTQQLIPGVKYFVSAYISRCDYYPIDGASNNFGFKFSTIQYSVGYPAPVNNLSHIRDTSVVSDSVNWTRIFGAFIADSSYQYLIIGNFYDNANTDTLDINNNQAGYYIDYVCVSIDSLTCIAPTGTNELIPVQNISIFPNPFNDKLNIHFEISKPVELSLYDIVSRKLLRQRIGHSTSISTSFLMRGIYIYEVFEMDRLLKRGTLIKE